MKSRLRVITDTPRRSAQDCGICRTQPSCWTEGISEEHIMTNLLVCRIKRGIDVNRSCKLFLEMVRPKLKNLAKSAIRGTNTDIDVAIADLESYTIEVIQHQYIQGEIAYPLHYLFGVPNGWVCRYANNYGKKIRKYEDEHIFKSESNPSNMDSIWEQLCSERPQEEEETETQITKIAKDIVDDGITLTTQEYRILKFCLTNATDAKRPLNGLHVFLARTTGMPRTKCTKIYSDAKTKMIKEAQVSH